jgi:hypothetical protein
VIDEIAEDTAGTGGEIMPNRIIIVFATLFALTLLAACRASVPA